MLFAPTFLEEEEAECLREREEENILFCTGSHTQGKWIGKAKQQQADMSNSSSSHRVLAEKLRKIALINELQRRLQPFEKHFSACCLLLLKRGFNNNPDGKSHQMREGGMA